jgi:hypothetical protein
LRRAEISSTGTSSYSTIAGFEAADPNAVAGHEVAAEFQN